MDAFQHRITLDETASIVRTAQCRGMLDGAKSAIFHHLGLMRARIESLHAAFPPGTLHAVAIKANPVVEILRESVRAGSGLEAASLEEVQLAIAAGCPPDRIVFDSPAKTADELRQALRLGVYINADNFDELRRIAYALETIPSQSIVGLRVNPMVGCGSIQHTSVSHSASKFGVPLQSARQEIIEAFAQYEWLAGLHLHVGSQGCSLDQLVAAATRAEELRRAIVERAHRPVAYIDIGGGLPTVYQTGNAAPTPAEYRAALERHVPQFFSGNTRFVTEFGRSIHANCGFAVSRVEYCKPSQQLAVIHLGADFLLRPVYRPADWAHEFFVLDGRGLPKAMAPRAWTIAGPLCFGGDIVARDIALPPIEEGDWIVIRDVGAYTLSMWSRHCSRCIPAVLGYDAKRAETVRILRPAETSADIVRLWS